MVRPPRAAGGAPFALPPAGAAGVAGRAAAVAVPMRPQSEAFGVFPGIDTTVERDDEDRV